MAKETNEHSTSANSLCTGNKDLCPPKIYMYGTHLTDLMCPLTGNHKVPNSETELQFKWLYFCSEAGF